MNGPRLASLVALAVTGLMTGCFRAPPTTAPAANRLIALTADRLTLMHDVARAKWSTKAAITDPEREKAFLRESADIGRPLGLKSADTTAFFAAQIDAAKLVQEADFRTWKAKRQPPFPDAPDLKRDVRPRIDRLSREMLAALAEYKAGPAVSPDTFRRLADQHMVDVPADVKAAALRPLVGK